MNTDRFVISDDTWARISEQVPGKVSDRGVTGKDTRLILEAVMWRVRTGSPWRDLPPGFGNWNSAFRRF
jgi:transposase